MAADLEKWIEIARDCKYLPENDLKQLCDLVCDLLIEESNIQPVSTPVTVCGDIHGQVEKSYFVFQNFFLILFFVFLFVISFMISKNYFDVADKYPIQIIYLWAILLIVVIIVWKH